MDITEEEWKKGKWRCDLFVRYACRAEPSADQICISNEVVYHRAQIEYVKKTSDERMSKKIEEGRAAVRWPVELLVGLQKYNMDETEKSLR